MPLPRSRTDGIDLNADLGEECGDDEALLTIVTTANVAAGGHAGGGRVLTDTINACIRRNVAVGAHISYPDKDNFGRKSLLNEMTADDLTDSLTEQLDVVYRAARKHGTPVTHVKPHGALYNDAADNPIVARLVFETVHTFCARVRVLPYPVMGLPNTGFHWAARQGKFPFLPEGFADRTYRLDGTLQPRSEPDAVLLHTEAIVEQSLMMARVGKVTTVPDGKIIPMPIETICLHGDTPGAVDHARAVREALTAEGVPVRRWSTR